MDGKRTDEGRRRMSTERAATTSRGARVARPVFGFDGVLGGKRRVERIVLSVNFPDPVCSAQLSLAEEAAEMKSWLTIARFTSRTKIVMRKEFIGVQAALKRDKFDVAMKLLDDIERRGKRSERYSSSVI
uniref:Uncharacterized protein n=1 Tax=Trichuris muris TaxID=70415 RepID=A0A5S6Q0N1_TRIMR